jgi:(1->4)-alpha-D-glucan 1-alpha-D-glucosylmutase
MSGESADRVSITLRAIYRIQLGPEHGFHAVRETLPYLHRLGISHLYLSPVFASRPGSTHGYDVTNHSLLNPELGGDEGFRALAAACKAQGMGLVLDIVPNHMAVMTADTAWWMDVLKNGPASQFAEFFDIDWAPARASMRNRLLVPVLGDPLGDVIDQHGIRLGFDRRQGSFCVSYGSLHFPLDPQTYALVFDAISQAIGEASMGSEEARQEYSSVRDAFAALPPARAAAPGILALRDRDQQVGQRRLARLCERNPGLADRIESALRQINQLPDERSADTLAALLAAQPYRLAFWRVSGEEINYRRFFDVNDLAALRMEDPRVFDATHTLLRELWQSGSIDGLRVDHADGLYDPAQYFHRLRELLNHDTDAGSPWIVAEKILGPSEQLPADWEVDGTTGYEFAALVTAWLMQDECAAELERTYRRFVGGGPSYADIAYQSRRHVMRSSLAAEVSGLAVRLDRLAQMHRQTSDFTLFDLREAIVEVVASFPVYRTYVRDGTVSSEDSQHIRRAVGAALSRNQSARRALQFLEVVLLGELTPDPRRRDAALQFTLKFQQVTAPVMAKGIEDTAYYRYPCLLAMNEVGGDPLCRGISTEALHRANEMRLRSHPRSVLATSTHDTKRGEDARYRLCVLTEVVDAWAACVGRWRRLKSRRRDASTIGAAQEYLLLQSLLAIWPLDAHDEEAPELRARMADYAVKAAREAKELTSWLEPDASYEEKLQHYVSLLLPEGSGTGFGRYFRAVVDPVAYFGALNSASACVLKFTSPGVSDTYQGNELPALVLVDPDNRRQPDLQAHARVLEELAAAIEATSLERTATTLLDTWRDGRLKLFLTWRLLTLRAANAALFEAGGYLPLQTEGAQAAHLCAYARTTSDCTLIVVVSRWTATLVQDTSVAPLGETWTDTRVLLPPEIPAGEYTGLFTGRTLLLGAAPDGPRGVKAKDLFQTLPVAVLMAGGVIPAIRTAAANDPSPHRPRRA